jgi:hypothetical protein
MATALAEAFVRFRAEASSIKPDVEREIDKVDGDGAGKKVGKKFGSGFSRTAKTAVAAFSGTLLAEGVIKFGKSSVKAYSEAQESQKQLQDAFERFPALADTNQGALQKLNSALQKKTKYDDDNIASGQAVLAQFKLTGTQLKDTTPLLLDYASRTGKDIPSAAQDVGKALLGNAKALKNIGIKYTATGDTQKDYTNITALMRAQVGGFAEKEGQTATGQAEIMKNQFGELEETVGSKLVPALMTMGATLLSIIGFVGAHSTIIGTAAVVVGVLAAGIYGLILANRIHAFVVKQSTEQTLLYTIWTKVAAAGSKVWAATQWLLNAALSANPIGLVIIGIIALVAVIVLAWKRSATFRAIVTGAFNAVLGAARATWGWIKANWPLLLAILTGPVGIAVLIISRNWDKITGFFKSAPGKIRSALSGVSSFITAPFRTAFNGIADAWNNTAGRLSFHIPDWVPKIGGKGFSMPKLPHFAAGVNGFAGGLAVLNERGPETVWLPAGSSVTPHGKTPQMGGGNTTQVIQLQVDGRTLAEVIVGPLGQVMANRPLP